jgi:hypothetical protein
VSRPFYRGGRPTSPLGSPVNKSCCSVGGYLIQAIVWFEWVNVIRSSDDIILCRAISNRAAHPVLHLAVKFAFVDSVMVARVYTGVTHDLVFPCSRHRPVAIFNSNVCAAEALSRSIIRIIFQHPFSIFARRLIACAMSGRIVRHLIAGVGSEPRISRSSCVRTRGLSAVCAVSGFRVIRPTLRARRWTRRIDRAAFRFVRCLV